MFYVKPDSGVVGSEVRRGQRLGYHTSMHCDGCYNSSMINHVHVELYEDDDTIDPTSYLTC